VCVVLGPGLHKTVALKKGKYSILIPTFFLITEDIFQMKL
jgi:hypothetical protein